MARNIEHIDLYNGKTVAGMKFDGYELFEIEFTDGTVLIIEETQQAGQITWSNKT